MENAAELGADERVNDEDDDVIEGLIRQAVQPMLRDWLDRDLPELVERIVRQEIKKLIERKGGL
jgi:cell pole-organizing protein PopZ